MPPVQFYRWRSVHDAMSSGLIASQSSAKQTKPDGRLCIHEVFELQAARSPDAIAVCCGDERLTYAELDRRANQLARYLQGAGVGPEVPVALYLERSLEMVIAILGVLKAGGAYVPIDLAYPKERLSFMLADTRAPILLTQQRLAGLVADSLQASDDRDPAGSSRRPVQSPQVICLDNMQFNGERTECSGKQPAPDNAAYIIYTSGSTGKPKGVVVTHHNVTRLLEQTAQWYQFNHRDVWPLFHSYAFDVSVWELWGCLFHGGRLVVVPYLVTRSPAEFYQLLAFEGATVLNQTPSAFRQLIWAEQAAPAKLPLKLRYVICAGEALELQSLKPWFELHGDEQPRVVNMYGITETTVHSTYRVIRKADLSSGVGSVIGIPIPDLQIHLLDENLRPVSAGRPGEIFVGGAGVARGYLNRPELTRQRFIPDTFSSGDGVLYRSGDLAQINEKGEMEYLGRMDHQVKIRGFRVELGEIESALNRHPAVRESVVIVQDGAAGDKRLVAYIVPRLEQIPSVTDLREALSRTIPDYMLPAVFVSLKSLPLTTNGKVDRRALPAPDGVRPQLRTTYVAPRSAVELALAGTWSEVLGVEKVGVNDNFFELGGDSIQCIRVLAKAQERGWRLALEQVFRNPTVAGLAQCIERGEQASARQSTQPFSLISLADRTCLPDTVEDAYPIGKLQLGMFYYNELDPASAVYHDVFTYRCRQRENSIQGASVQQHELHFDRDKLQQAIQSLVSRHPMLRTSFHLAGYSEPLQLVHRTVTVPLTCDDLRSLPAAEQEKALAHWIEAEKRRPFDRAVAPLCRFHTQWRSEKEFQLFVSFHHCCIDGWSLAAVVTEIFREYSALLAGKPENIAQPGITYRDFIALEQETIHSETCREFWTQQVADTSAPLLPRWPKLKSAPAVIPLQAEANSPVGDACQDADRPAHEQRRGPELFLSPAVLEGLKRLAQQTGVPLKTVLLAGHQRVMSLLYGQSDVMTGLIANGRPEEPDGERLIGLFLNTVPLRQQLNGGSWRQLVQETFRAEQELMPHRRMPLAEIQKLHGGQPLFETAFDFVHFHVLKDLESLPNLAVAESDYFEANNLTTYTTLMLDVSSTKLEIHIDYDPISITREQVERMSEYYVRTFSALATSPDAPYETFSALSEAETRQLFLDWNTTEADFPRCQGIHEIIAGRAAETPEAIALVFGKERISYLQLEQRAAATAEKLRALDVQAGALIGLFIERSVEMVAALLGVLKCGAAYVPLDPAYPKERLAFMLEDSQAGVIVTQRALIDLLPETGASMLCVDDANRDVTPGRGREESKAATVEALSPRSSVGSGPESLAYVIYTSGSTGKPKGVPVTHRSVLNLLTSAARTAGITCTDNLLAVTTLSFDIAGLELWMPLVLGGTVTIAGGTVTNDGIRLGALIQSSGATVMQATPATWRLLIESGWPGNRNVKAFCGGEALKRSLADELLARVKEVWNFYGPTETTIWSTAARVWPNEPITIGRPLGNTQLYILDARQQPVPVGVAGELYIGGEGVACGYLNRPELAAERFVSPSFFNCQIATLCPPLCRPGSRLYRTGDRARYLPDGRVEYLGRLDHQVKIRGFRIELGEVETILRQHPGIADVVVTASEDGLGEKRLVGYIKSRNGPLSASELREYVKSRLPFYMVPAAFVLLQQFPLTPNGKIDLKQLPRPEGAVQSARTYLPPRSAEERDLAQIWQEVLLVDRVGIDDSFFELGGDSLAATRAFARANKTFGMALTLREMLERPTIRSLAELVATAKGTATPTTSFIPRQPRRAGAAV